jgi:hypothetical protein
MSLVKQYSRIAHHTLVGLTGSTFSIPASSDFTDGTWTSYDLYLSEFGVNQPDNKLFVRIGNNINEIGFNTPSYFSGETSIVTTGLSTTQPFTVVLKYSSPDITLSSTSVPADTITFSKTGLYKVDLSVYFNFSTSVSTYGVMSVTVGDGASRLVYCVFGGDINSSPTWPSPTSYGTTAISCHSTKIYNFGAGEFISTEINPGFSSPSGFCNSTIEISITKIN